MKSQNKKEKKKSKKHRRDRSSSSSNDSHRHHKSKKHKKQQKKKRVYSDFESPAQQFQQKRQKQQKQKVFLKGQSQNLKTEEYQDHQQKDNQKAQQSQQQEHQLLIDPKPNPNPKPAKQLPCFEPSGILLQFYNSRDGVSLRFSQPPQARAPTNKWRIYVFKGQQVLSNQIFDICLEPIILKQSCYLIGKDQRIADILAENPSISRQHSVIQFRLIQKRQVSGEFDEVVKPYIMDLESTNGTFLNDQRIQSGRYYQLLHKDVLKFGFSDRQYVIVEWQGQNDDQQR